MYDELHELVDELADVAGLPVQLTDARLNSVAFGPHPDTVDWIRRETLLSKRTSPRIRQYLDRYHVESATEPLWIPADPAEATMARLVVPVRSQGRTTGFLWFLSDGPPPQGEAVDRILVVADRLGLLLMLESDSQSATADNVRRLVGDHLTNRLEAMRYLLEHGLFPRHSAVAVGVVAPMRPIAAHRGFAEVALMLAAPRGLDGNVLRAVTDDCAILILPAVVAGLPRRMMERALRVIGDATDPGEHAAGLGASYPTLAYAAESYAQARCALRAARAMSEHRPVGQWERLGAVRAITMIPPDATEQAIDPRLLPVLGEPLLVQTLEAFLAHAGDIQRTSRALHVHRGTVYYRLHRVEELTRLSLRVGEDRLTMHLGLHLARIAGLL